MEKPRYQHELVTDGRTLDHDKEIDLGAGRWTGFRRYPCGPAGGPAGMLGGGRCWRLTGYDDGRVFESWAGVLGHL